MGNRLLRIESSTRGVTLYNLLLAGPPGTGKTLLASRLPGLLPPLDEEEALQVAAIHSVAGPEALEH